MLLSLKTLFMKSPCMVACTYLLDKFGLGSLTDIIAGDAEAFMLTFVLFSRRLTVKLRLTLILFDFKSIN